MFTKISAFCRKVVSILRSEKKLLIAFEYGVIITQVALEHKVEVTPEMIKRAEEMLINEFKTQDTTHMATNMIPNIMAIFEIDDSKPIETK